MVHLFRQIQYPGLHGIALHVEKTFLPILDTVSNIAIFDVTMKYPQYVPCFAVRVNRSRC